APFSTSDHNTILCTTNSFVARGTLCNVDDISVAPSEISYVADLGSAGEGSVGFSFSGVVNFNWTKADWESLSTFFLAFNWSVCFAPGLGADDLMHNVYSVFLYAVNLYVHHKKGCPLIMINMIK